MLLKDGLVVSMLRKHWRPAVCAAAAVPLLLFGAGARAASPADGPVQLLFTVPVPVAKSNTTGGMYSFDISFVDAKSHTYVLGDRSNAAVDEVDAQTGLFKRQLLAKPPFAGVAHKPDGSVDNDKSGPDGVAIGGGCIFAGDGPSRVVSFNQATGKQVGDVKTGGTTRADEMAFDPKDRVLFAVNNAESPPFGTFIAVAPNCGLTVGKRVTFDAAHGVNATNGAEQPAWDPITQRFYNSIPEVGPSGIIGGVARINMKSARVDGVVLLPFCLPNGLSIGPDDVALAGCGTNFDTAGKPWSGTDPHTATPYQFLVDLRNMVIQGVVPGVGPSDEVWFNSGDNHFYTGSSGSPYAPSVVVKTTPPTPVTDQGAAVLGVIDGSSQTLDQLVPTFNVPSVKGVHPSGSSHSVAADSANNLVFVPHPANNAIPGCLRGCIGVYGRADSEVTD